MRDIAAGWLRPGLESEGGADKDHEDRGEEELAPGGDFAARWLNRARLVHHEFLPRSIIQTSQIRPKDVKTLNT